MTKLLDDAREAGLAVWDDKHVWADCQIDKTQNYVCITDQLTKFAELQQSQGEPVGYLRFITNETVKFISKNNFKLVLKGASPIITSYPDLPVYTEPPLTEALQKDKEELIEYAENILGALDAIMIFGTNIDKAKEFAKMALAIPQPNCLQEK